MLSSLSAQDFLKDLQKHSVLFYQGSDILLASLVDPGNLDFNTTVKYLLHVVGERVKVDNTLCAHFLKALTGFKYGCGHIGRIFSEPDKRYHISQSPEEKSGHIPETVFLEKSVFLEKKPQALISGRSFL